MEVIGDVPNFLLNKWFRLAIVLVLITGRYHYREGIYLGEATASSAENASGLGGGGVVW